MPYPSRFDKARGLTGEQPSLDRGAADGGEEGVCTRPVGGVAACVGVDKAAFAVENEITAQLQKIVLWGRGVGPSASQDEAQIAQDDPGAGKRPTRASLHPEGPIRSRIGVAGDGEREFVGCRVGRRPLRAAEGDNQHLAPKFADLFVAAPHLPEVLLALDSAQVSQEDHQEGSPTESGEPQGRPVRTKQFTVWSRLADFERHSHSHTPTTLPGPTQHRRSTPARQLVYIPGRPEPRHRPRP